MTIDITLEPSERPYFLVVSARIGNIKFTEVPWTLSVKSEKKVGLVQKVEPSMSLLIDSILYWIRKVQGATMIQIESRPSQNEPTSV